MSNDHFPTSLWGDGQIRMLNTKAIPVYVRNKGAHAGGHRHDQGCRAAQQYIRKKQSG